MVVRHDRQCHRKRCNVETEEEEAPMKAGDHVDGDAVVALEQPAVKKNRL